MQVLNILCLLYTSLSLDVNSHIFANYIVTCKTSVKEREKLEQKVKVIEQKHNALVDTVNELKARCV